MTWVSAHRSVKTRDLLCPRDGHHGAIGTATGIITERHGIDDERAFEFLTRVSMSSNLRSVATEVIERAIAGYSSGA